MGAGLQWGGNDNDPSGKGNTSRLREKLNEADTERRKDVQAALDRERAGEIRREERQKKINYMQNMPDSTPAGTGKFLTAMTYPPRVPSLVALSNLSFSTLSFSQYTFPSSTTAVEEFMFKEGVQDQLDKLDRELVGLVPVKRRVKEIAALLVLDKMRRKLGFETSVPSLHMSFTGAPGTGKTTVAVRMGQILAKMGYSRSGHVVLATRDDLVGQYVGHTAPKTKEMIKKAMGGVLLVDEAYYLFNAANDRDYGQESIEILLNVMETQQDDLVVALAGYKDRMDKFFSYIPGMMSRIGNHIDFPNYSADELVQIAAVMAGQLEYDIDDEAYAVFKTYIELRMELPFFSNARTVRNAMDRARMNSAIRTFERFAINGENGGVCTVADLKSIRKEDFQTLVDDIVNADPTKVIFS
jgi:probable Rubsico expression protein CbbX